MESLLGLAMVGTVLTGSTLLAACGDEASDRPAMTEWKPMWLGTRDLVPEAERIEEDGTNTCGEFLGEVRERRNDLTRTPDPSLDEPVGDWVSEAETVGLDCEREGDLAERLDDLETRADEIDALIEQLGG